VKKLVDHCGAGFYEVARIAPFPQSIIYSTTGSWQLPFTGALLHSLVDR
jgi:hypothetical protein